MRELVLTPETKDKQAVVQAWLDRFEVSHRLAEEPHDDESEHPYSWALEAKTADEDVFLVAWLPSMGALQVQYPFGVHQGIRSVFDMMSTMDRLVFLSDVAAVFFAKGLDYKMETEDVDDSGEEEDVTARDGGSALAPTRVAVQGTLVVDGPVSRKDFFAHYRLVIGTGHVAATMFNKLGMLRRWS